MKRPSANDFSVRNYVDEFQWPSWLATFVTYVAHWLLLTVLIVVKSRQPYVINRSMLQSLSATLRGTIAKVSNYADFNHNKQKLLNVISF